MRIKSLQPNDDNSYTKIYYQVGLKNKKIHNMNKILKKIIDPKVYDILRSKQQLGYAVGCQIDSFGGVQGVSIVVMSQEHKHKFSAIHSKIDEFMDTVVIPAINDMSQEEFEKVKDARVKELQQDLLGLDDETSLNWEEIENEHYLFEKAEVFIEVTKQLTLEEFKEFFNSFASPEKQRKLCIQIIGSEETDENVTTVDDVMNVEFISKKYTDHNLIVDIEAFQKDLHLYPVLDKLD